MGATLTWDRTVTPTAVTPAALAMVGNYASAAPSDLDLQLFKVGDPNPVAASVSTVDNVEHIYFNVREDGKYDLKVLNNSGGNAVQYGLAWSSGSSSGISFSDDGGAFNAACAGTANPAEGLLAPFGDNPYPNDVNALGTAGPANFATEAEIFTSSGDGTNMQRLSGALGTQSRVGPHNGPPAAEALLAAGTTGVLGLVPNDNIISLSWGTDGTDRNESILLFSVDPDA